MSYCESALCHFFIKLLLYCIVLSDVIAKHFISYVQRCLTSDCDIVNYVVQYGIWFGHMASPVGCSVQHCCNKYGFTADDIACVSTKSIDKYFLQNVVDIARMLLELIFIRDVSLHVNLPCFAHDVLFLISYLSTM